MPCSSLPSASAHTHAPPPNQPTSKPGPRTDTSHYAAPSIYSYSRVTADRRLSPREPTPYTAPYPNATDRIPTPITWSKPVHSKSQGAVHIPTPLTIRLHRPLHYLEAAARIAAPITSTLGQHRPPRHTSTPRYAYRHHGHVGCRPLRPTSSCDAYRHRSEANGVPSGIPHGAVHVPTPPQPYRPLDILRGASHTVTDHGMPHRYTDTAHSVVYSDTPQRRGTHTDIGQRRPLCDTRPRYAH